MAETKPRQEATRAEENGAAPPAEDEETGIRTAGEDGSETAEAATHPADADDSAGEDAAEEETDVEETGTRVYFFRKSANSKVEHILGSTEEAAIDRDDGRIEFSAGGDLDLKVGDLVSSRLIASEPIHRVERETRGDEIDYTVWYEREEES